MVRQGVIAEVTEPCEWCAPMVPVIKKDNNVRICVDLKRLNESVQRERYIIPSKEDVIGSLASASVFSVLDAKSGFWQIPLDNESSSLTTFITPFGRFRFLRLPFRISSATEIFRRRMSDILKNVKGCVCVIFMIFWFSDQIVPNMINDSMKS
ncbi:Uncharacterised protein r2_g3686 [Pycnogonum litorale]